MRSSVFEKVNSKMVKVKSVHAGMLILLMVMLASGLIVLFSASIGQSLSATAHRGYSASYFIIRQIIYTLIGLIVFFIALKFDIRIFNKRPFVVIALGISFILLILVILPFLGEFNKPTNGARRWLRPLGSLFSFQPTEFTKVVVIFYLSWYYSNLQKLRRTKDLIFPRKFKKQWIYDIWIDFFKPLLPIGISLVLIMMETHASAAIIISLVTIFLVCISGISRKSLALAFTFSALLLSMLIALLVALNNILPDDFVAESRWAHIPRRLVTFFNEEEASRDSKIQIEQAKIAIGSGGLTGVGLGRSRQKFNYLAEGQNDYIFSLICEELGFIGGVSVIILFIIFLIMGLGITLQARSQFTRMMAAGYTILIVIQAFFSIAVNLNLMPSTGISLPFFSYGGTSNLFFLFSVSVILNISKYETNQEI